jgi:hypothetical protein
MLELKDAVEKGMGSQEAREIKNLFRNLFKEWLLDLNSQEREIWLWNALVEMEKVKERRSLM